MDYSSIIEAVRKYGVYIATGVAVLGATTLYVRKTRLVNTLR